MIEVTVTLVIEAVCCSESW